MSAPRPLVDAHGHLQAERFAADRDLVVGVLARDTQHITTLEVGDILTSEVVTARAEADHEDVLRSMQQNGIRRMPVVDARGALVGIVSLDDLLDHLAYELAGATSLMSRQAQREREVRLGAEDYADQILSTLETNLGKFLSAVQRGREQLAQGRSDLGGPTGATHGFDVSTRG